MFLILRSRWQFAVTSRLQLSYVAETAVRWNIMDTEMITMYLTRQL